MDLEEDMEPDQKLLNMDKLLVGPVEPLEEELDKDSEGYQVAMDQVASEPDQVALEPDQVAMDPGAEQDQEGCQVGFQEGTAVLPGGKGATVLDLNLRQTNTDQVGQEGPLVLGQLEVQGLGQGLGPELGQVLEEVQDLHLALAQEQEEMAL